MLCLTSQEMKAVQAFKERLLKKYATEVLTLKLFGSRARGEGDENSDLDILVLLKEETSTIRNFTFELAADIFLEFEIDISPLVMSQNHFEDMKKRERLLPQEIERDGKLI